MGKDGDPSGRQLQFSTEEEDLKPPGGSDSGVIRERERETDAVMAGFEEKGGREDAPSREESQGEWKKVNRKGRKKGRRKEKQKQKEKTWFPSIAIFGSKNLKGNRDAFLLQEKVTALNLGAHDAFTNAQGTVRLLFENQEKQAKALAHLRTPEGQGQVNEQFGENARVERGLSPHRMAFLRVPQRDGKESFKTHLERAGFTVEHIEYRGQEGRRTHTRIVTVSEGERAREVITRGELKLGLFVKYQVGEVHARPPQQCFRCQEWGCFSATCTNKQACRKCGGPHRSSTCDIAPAKRYCINCGGNHGANSFLCPKRPKTEQQRAQLGRINARRNPPQQRAAKSTTTQSTARTSERMGEPTTVAPAQAGRHRYQRLRTKPTSGTSCTRPST